MASTTIYEVKAALLTKLQADATLSAIQVTYGAPGGLPAGSTSSSGTSPLAARTPSPCPVAGAAASSPTPWT